MQFVHRPLPVSPALALTLGSLLIGCASNPPSPAPKLPEAAPASNREAAFVSYLRENLRNLRADEQLRFDTAVRLLHRVDSAGIGSCIEIMQQGLFYVAVVPAVEDLTQVLGLKATISDSLLIAMPTSSERPSQSPLYLLCLSDMAAGSMPTMIHACNREFIALERSVRPTSSTNSSSPLEQMVAVDARMKALIRHLESRPEPSLQLLAQLLAPTPEQIVPQDEGPQRLRPRR